MSSRDTLCRITPPGSFLTSKSIFSFPQLRQSAHTGSASWAFPRAGDGCQFLKGYAYMLRSEKNSALIEEIEAGIKKEVRIGGSGTGGRLLFQLLPLPQAPGMGGKQLFQLTALLVDKALDDPCLSLRGLSGTAPDYTKFFEEDFL